MSSLLRSPKAAKNTFGPHRTLPESVIRWVDSEEGLDRIAAAIDKSLRDSADQQAREYAIELIEKPMTKFT